MRLLDWLLGGSIPEPKLQSASEVVRDGDWLRIGNDFFGQYEVSPNDLFTFGWSDFHMETTSSGGTRNVSGRYVLLEGDSVILKGQMQRPNDGHVANNGTFAVCDWMFTTGLKGTFRLIDKSGNPLISHLFEANLNKCGISIDGRFAVCQTCNADSSDGNKLSFFDVKSGKLLWKIYPPTGWADSYKFDVEKGILYSCHRDKGEFAYSFSGEFLDAARWRDVLFTKGNSWEVVFAVSEALAEAKKTNTTPDYAALLATLDQTRVRSQADRPDMQAQIERAIAEIYDMQNMVAEAIQHYETAISLDAKVGVKRRLYALRKRAS